MQRTLFSLFLVLSILNHDAPSGEAAVPLQENSTTQRQLLETPADWPVQVKLKDGNLGLRYRLQTDKKGKEEKNLLQYQVLMNVRVSFFQDKVRLDFGGGSGNSVSSGWNNTGLGTPDDTHTDLFLKRLTLTYAPTKNVEVSLGSMGAEYGAGSQDSYLDSDAYIMGYRAKVTLEQGEIVVTTASLGDFDKPNVWDRFHKLDDFNYVQAIVTRAIGNIVKASLDYTHALGDDYARGVVSVDVKRWMTFLDTLSIEGMVNASQSDKHTTPNVITFALAKRFKEILPGNRDLMIRGAYINNNDITLPIHDKIFQGQQMRITVSVPNLYKINRVGDLGTYAELVQDVDDFDRFRFETGMMLKFN